MSAWNFADVWEVVAEALPTATATAHAGLHRSWAETEARADGLAAWLLESGLARGDTFAQYLYSGPEYIESLFAAFKVGTAPVNTNYRYGGDELVYLWDNGDVGAVVFHATFGPLIERIRDRVPRVKVVAMRRGWHGAVPAVGGAVFGRGSPSGRAADAFALGPQS